MAELEYSVKDHIATILLNRPEARNAFSPDMLKAWREALRDAQDDPEVRVVVVTGAGSAFCAGGDMTKRSKEAANPGHSKTPMDHKDMLRNGPQSVGLAVAALEKPYIAAVNGYTIGAGMDMALMCDIRVASKSAKFAEAYLRVGLVAGNGGCYYLPRVVGLAKALELFFTGDMVDAEEALRIGLVSRVWDDDKLMEETYKFAAKIAGYPPIATRIIKRTIYQSQSIDLRTSLELSSSHQALITTTEDSREAITAFKEKRPGVYKNR